MSPLLGSHIAHQSGISCAAWQKAVTISAYIMNRVFVRAQGRQELVHCTTVCGFAGIRVAAIELWQRNGYCTWRGVQARRSGERAT